MEEREEETVFSIWVDWENKVISFSKENGFEELRFPTHEEKFRFAIDRGNEGFGIQSVLIMRYGKEMHYEREYGKQI